MPVGMSGAALETEAELEDFRKRWREEVSARNKNPEANRTKHEHRDVRSEGAASRPLATVPSTARRKETTDYSEEVEPHAYHDLPDKEEQMRLGQAGQNYDRYSGKEPASALEHYEHAVEKETQGQLGASIKHYRQAFKLDDGVHEMYKKKHFPPSSFMNPKPGNSNPSNAAVTVPGTGHHSLQDSGNALPPTLKQMIEDFSTSRIEAMPPPTDASPQQRSPLADLPEEILSHTLADLAIVDIASFARMAQVCKRLAYLVLTEEAIWKRVAIGKEYGFGAMHYDYQCDIEGFPHQANDEIARFLGSNSDPEHDVTTLQSPSEQRAIAFSALTEQLLRSTYSSSWRQMFRSRPRLRFNGCYISTVNYNRPGVMSTNTLTWGTPVHVVTYFRYLRFFRDGTAISLLTVAEPADVVHHLTKENLHHHHGAVLPSSVMKDALRGRWRLSGPAASPHPVVDPATGTPSAAAVAEVEGDVHVDTEGAVPKYTYRLLLALSHAGKSSRNNKLAWKGFWSHNRLTDDWGEFQLKNDRAFYWSRVKSYGTGLEAE